jgi:hypothetical protein
MNGREEEEQEGRLPPHSPQSRVRGVVDEALVNAAWGWLILIE